MKISNRGIKMLMESEGIRLQPYKDSVGKWTIGVGHLMLPSDPMRAYTYEEVLALFEQDLIPREKSINDLVKVDLEQYEYDALVHFVFNIGVSAFAKSTLLKLLNANDKVSAGKQFMRWTKQKELIPRRQRETNLFVNGIYFNEK